jgi:hypothetical protein
MKTIFTLLTFLVILCCATDDASAQEKKVDALFCKLSLSEHTKQSNITFTNRYFFRIDSNGKPLKISRVSGYDFISDDEVRDCINDWKFEGFTENTSFIIEIAWQHGVGWMPMKIRSKGYSKTVKPFKGKNAYNKSMDVRAKQLLSFGGVR